MAARRELTPAAEAYDRWSASYDEQRHNVVMHVEQGIFDELVRDVGLRAKTVVDVGCGTGRHWPRMLADRPAALVGYDVSRGMLARLAAKHPDADIHQIAGHELAATATGSADVVVSALAVSHMPDLDAALGEWCRALRPVGDVVITDLHPEIGAISDVTFNDGVRTVSINHHVRPLAELEATAAGHGLAVARLIERVVDDGLRPFYEASDALAIFNRTKGMRLAFGVHLRRPPR